MSETQTTFIFQGQKLTLGAFAFQNEVKSYLQVSGIITKATLYFRITNAVNYALGDTLIIFVNDVEVGRVGIYDNIGKVVKFDVTERIKSGTNTFTVRYVRDLYSSWIDTREVYFDMWLDLEGENIEVSKFLTTENPLTALMGLISSPAFITMFIAIIMLMLLIRALR